MRFQIPIASAYNERIVTFKQRHRFADRFMLSGDVFEQKMEALKELKAQPHLVELYATCNRWRGIECGCQHAEAFVRFAPLVPRLEGLGG